LATGLVVVGLQEAALVFPATYQRNCTDNIILEESLANATDFLLVMLMEILDIHANIVVTGGWWLTGLINEALFEGAVQLVFQVLTKFIILVNAVQ